MSTNIFEEKNIQLAILKLGIPAMVGQLATLIYNLADTYFVSMTRNPAQIAAVTLSTPILLIIMSVSSVCGMGGSSVIARLLGEKDNMRARSCITFCLYAMALAGIVVLAAGMLFITRIAKLAGADAENLAYTCDYLKWIFLGAPFIILSNGLVHIFRSAGLIRQATIGVVLGNGINILLDWVLIIRLGMGTAGAALATSIGFFCATAYDLACIFRASGKSDLFSLSPGAMRASKVPAGSIIKIDMFPIMLSVGLSQGIAPLIGYCYGAKQTERLNKVMINGMIDTVLLGAVFTIAFLSLAGPLTSIFLHEKALTSQSALFLRIMGLSAPMLGIINMVTAYYQALGKAVSSLFITVLRNALLFIPCVIILNALFGVNYSVIELPEHQVYTASPCRSWVCP